MEGKQITLLESATIWSGRGDLNARPPAPKAGKIDGSVLDSYSYGKGIWTIGRVANTPWSAVGPGLAYGRNRPHFENIKNPSAEHSLLQILLSRFLSRSYSNADY